ncbi:DUF3772 domain-containing protein [Palleronia sp. LCG004]|uniref:DUF3772 domain-containing protein n=1 Tax=Palleronia sp. LCG004 TaxID=3079304 RepID=UPI002942F178|nr:DUF3772 domain-containing protein [Palleronia sp. LCG004]WOI55083.1 DUF3772 domain-containing protein [Palleronia sp. LCG004]
MGPLFRAIAVVLLLALPAAAQTPEPPDFDAWSSFAEDAQERLNNEGNISDLEALRVELAERRSKFLAAQNINSARISTVQSQIDSLGAPPAEGEDPEAPEVAQRRATLNEQLSELRAPVVAAEEAYTLSDALIAQIDSTIREQYAEQFLAREASPLNPAHWGPGIDFLAQSWSQLADPVRLRWQDPRARGRAIGALPIAIPLATIGLMLVFRSRWWIRIFARWVVSQTPRGRGVLFFLLSLGQIAFPMLGMFLFARATDLTNLLNGPPQDVLNASPLIVAPIFVAKWLINVLFKTEALAPTFWQEDGPLLRGLRRATSLLGYTLAVLFLIEAFAHLTERSDIAVDVVRYIPRLILGILLFRAGRVLMGLGNAELPGQSRNIGGSFTRLIGRLSIFAGIAGIALASIGYSNATQSLLIPAAMTLALTACLGLLQKLVSDLYALITGTPEGESEALAPLLIGFGIVILSLPLYALIWGARVADLTEIWSRFRAGFSVGETRISPADFLTFLLIFAIGYGLTRFMQGTLRNTVLPKTRLDVGGRNAIVAGVGYVGIFLAAIIAITSAGIDLSSLAIVAGALSVGIGFGLQNVVSNFVSGIILLIERPISEGDWIQVGDQMGYVRNISVRSTRIETFDRTDVIVPNADLVSGTVTNWTRGNNTGRVIVPVGVAYGTDTEWVTEVLREVAEAHPMVVLNPPPAVLFRAFGADSLEFEIRAILRDVNFVLNVQSDMLHGIAKRFKEEGIEIPFAQRDLWLRNPEALHPKEAAS